MAKKEKIPDNNQLYEQLKGLRDKLAPKESFENYNKSEKVNFKKNPIQKTATGYIHNARPKFLGNNKKQKYIAKEKINYYSDQPPIVTRIYLEDKKRPLINSKKMVPQDQQEIKIEVSKFPKPPKKYSWTKKGNTTSYKFDFSLGDKFQPSNFSDKEDREMTIGMDFGTSSTKITIRDIQDSRSFAIPFSNNQDIQAFLLPTKIFFNKDKFSFNSTGKECSNLKIKAITSEVDDFDIFTVISYMALVIRHARTHFFKKYDKNFKGQRFLWRLNVGIPARTVQKFEIKDRYTRISRAAFICSHGLNDFVSLAEAESAFKISDTKTITQEFNKLPEQIKISFDNNSVNFIEDGVGLYPEIMAQIHGYVHSNEWNQQSNPHIMMIDVGAGTLDLSLCGVRQDEDFELNYYPLACLVEGLGVSNLVKHRESFILEAANDLNDEDQSTILETLSCLDNINYGEINVPSLFEEMMIDFEFTDGQTKKYIDKKFISKLQSAIWTHTVLEASKGSKETDTTWKSLPVFLCGGGSRMSFYNDVFVAYEKVTNAKAQFSIRHVPQPSDLYDVEAGTDYDRLSVAYGLGFWNLGNFIANFENPKMNVDGDDSPGWSNNFVSKDMT